MKRIRVAVTEEYLLPDDWLVLTHPEDKIACLHGDLEYFMPVLEWAQRGPLHLPGKYQSLLKAQWSTVDDARGNWFIERMETQDSEIRPIE